MISIITCSFGSLLHIAFGELSMLYLDTYDGPHTHGWSLTFGDPHTHGGPYAHGEPETQ